MNVAQLEAFFDKHEDEFLKFERIANPRHPRPDVCAFLMLHDLDPGELTEQGKGHDMVSSAEHDEIYLSAGPVAVAAAATEEQLIDLIRCGVRYDGEYESFCMFA